MKLIKREFCYSCYRGHWTSPLIKELIKSHKFFVRKSQHFILGNWSQYVPLSKQKWKEYYKRYPKAYFKFMWLSFKDARQKS